MGHRLEFRIPRDQEDECERLAGSLYMKGLTQEQVCEVFEDVYGDRYSKSSISRMVERVRREVGEWLGRRLERYYPALTVTSEGRREVLGVSNIPAESVASWGLVFDGLKRRALERVGLVMADGIAGLESAVARKLPGAALQHCVTHLKRGILARARPG